MPRTRRHLAAAAALAAALEWRASPGLGIVAASVDKLSDCDGDFYYASLHTGATAWYIMASGSIDPFTLFAGSSGR